MLNSITCCMKLEMVKLDISMFQTEKILAKEVNVVVRPDISWNHY